MKTKITKKDLIYGGKGSRELTGTGAVIALILIFVGTYLVAII